MNKQELIERLNNKLDETFAFQQSFKPLTWTHMECESKANAYMTAINYVEQLGESEKNLASTIKLLTNLEPDDFLKELKLYGLAKEPQKVKVPEFMKEFLDFCIEDEQNGVEAYHGLFHICSSWPKDDILQWSFEDPYRFVNAFQYGYEVEDEPKYYLVIPYYGYMTGNKDQPFVDRKEDASLSTEFEIKAVDERLWPFAVPVEKV